MNGGFADLCLTTWLRRRGRQYWLEQATFSTHHSAALSLQLQLRAFLGAILPRLCPFQAPSDQLRSSFLFSRQQLSTKASGDLRSVLDKVRLRRMLHVP